uniref:Uncharacterized protein n=1 Tax=Rhizophora mucronata TaxID=61149 RepID=A0A2P2PPW5_RHIMU
MLNRSEISALLNLNPPSFFFSFFCHSGACSFRVYCLVLEEKKPKTTERRMSIDK